MVNPKIHIILNYEKVIVTGINGLIDQYIYKPLYNLDFEIYEIGTKLKNEKSYFCSNLNNHLELSNIFNNINQNN